MNKAFMPVDEQLEKLKKRGVNLSTTGHMEKARHLILNEGYYNLINGYKFPFLLNSTNPDTYRQGTTVNEIFSLYTFDIELKQAFLPHLLHVETIIKSKVAYVFSEKYGHDNYLKYDNFDLSAKDSAKKIYNMLGTMNNTISKKDGDARVKHYLYRYGYIPLWVLHGVSTMGQISIFYSLMKPSERSRISKDYSIPEKTLQIYLSYLTDIRNICAHSNRLYNIKLKKKIPKDDMHVLYNMPSDKGGNYQKGTSDVFAAIIVLKRLLSKNEFRRFCIDCKKVYKRLDKHLYTIELSDIYNYGGFPSEWNNETWNELMNSC